jgi:putative phage-type endonuclease
MTSPIIYRNFAQHSPEWFAVKAGKWSASNAATIMGGLDTSGLSSLVQDIAWERVFGATDSGFRSDAMERGIALESEARRWYEQETGCAVEEVAFVAHAKLPTVGWSPDGMIEEGGAVEIKCPLHKAWMACRKAMKVPAEYRWQTRWGMWVGQLEWQDFVMYHPMTGGIVISCEVTAEEKEQMEERVVLLETKVAPWVEIIGNSRNTFRPSPQVEAALDIADATF